MWRLPFLKMCVILPSFQSCGSCPSINVLQNMVLSGSISWSVSSTRTRGWRPSGPGDLEVFSLPKNCFTSSLVMFKCVSSLLYGLSSNAGSLSWSSCVKTLVKNLFKTLLWQRNRLPLFRLSAPSHWFLGLFLILTGHIWRIPLG